LDALLPPWIDLRANAPKAGTGFVFCRGFHGLGTHLPRRRPGPAPAKIIIIFIWLTIFRQYAVLKLWTAPIVLGEETGPMFRVSQVSPSARLTGLAVLLASALLSACSSDLFSSGPTPAQQQPAQQQNAIGSGQIKIGLILPLSAGGNAGVVAVSMKNAAEMALADLSNPNVQILVKDDAGNAQTAQQAAQQALDEHAEIILGPLFAPTVGPVGQVARSRGVPVIAFSTDANVAARGVYLLSFLAESDVDRIVEYATANGKRSFAALIPDNAYGSVVEAAFNQAVTRRGGRIVTLQHYPQDKALFQGPVRQVAQAARGADAIFIPDGGDARAMMPLLAQGGVDLKRVQILGTGLWDDLAVFSDASLQGAWYAGPDSAGFRNFLTRYRTKYGQDPARTATLAYDAVTLVAALAKTQGERRFSDEVLTNGSGFTGIDGLFRFKPDGTNQRGLAVMRVSSTGGQIISPPPKSFSGS
jgi:branched-chain amino acid transport system substrate-binding protein